MFRIDPPPVEAMCLPKIWQPQCTAFRLLSRTRSQSSSFSSKYGPALLTPAPLMSMSTRPCVETTVAQQFLDRLAAHDIDRREGGPAAGGLDLLDAGRPLLGVAAGDDDRRTGPGQPLGQRRRPERPCRR